MKQIKYLVIFSYITGLFIFNSCLSSSVTDYSDDARIYSFSLKSDSVPAFAKRTFTVNHTNGAAYKTNGTIYNVDSLPFKTKLTGNFKAIPVISSYSSAAMYFNDTIYSSGDSIDFRWRHVLKNYAGNGNDTMTYFIDLRIHKVQPDSIAWEKRSYPSYSYTETEQKAVYCNNLVNLFVNSGTAVNLYTTDRALSWTSSTTNLPATVALQNIVPLNNTLYVIDNTGAILKSADGKSWSAITAVSSPNTLKSLIGSYNNKLFAIARDNSNNYYVETSSDGNTWSIQYSVSDIENSTNTLNNNKANGAFPISDYAVATFTPPTGSSKLLLIGGKDKTGNTINSVYSYAASSGKWVDLSTEIPIDSFPARKNASVAWYDDRVMLYGGTDTKDALITDTLLCSKTEGLIWTRNDTLVSFPKQLNYQLRTKASVIVDKDNRIFLIGGRTGNNSNSAFFREAWVGRKNKLGFGLSPK